jgi:hypothetical protein
LIKALAHPRAALARRAVDLLSEISVQAMHRDHNRNVKLVAEQASRFSTRERRMCVQDMNRIFSMQLPHTAA